MDSNLLICLDNIIKEKQLVCICLQSPIYDYMMTTHIYYYTLTDEGGIELYIENDDVITAYNFSSEYNEEEIILSQDGNKIVISLL